MDEPVTTMLTSMLHVGIATFMKSPYVPLDKLRDVKADVAFLGAPFEQCCCGIPGASFGPRVLRQASDDLMTYNLELDLDLADHIKMVDVGDAPSIPGSVELSHKNIEDGVAAICRAGAFPVTMGGDHSITLPSFKGFYRESKAKKFGVIQIDTHQDFADEYGGQKISNCTQMTRISEMDRVDPHNMVQIGMRNMLAPKEEIVRSRKAGVTTFFIWDVFKRGIEDVTREAVKIARNGTDALYLTVDIDCLDAAYAPATSVPTPGGLTSRQLIEAVRIIGKSGIDAFDLSEVSGPNQDSNLITARAGATVIAELIGAKVYGKLHK